jgi:succinate dehydrogenase/fumarate reductase-like Fe-S protein
MKVKVFRYDLGKKPEPWYDEYEVPLANDGNHTVMDVLDYIFTNLDGTLSYYRHSVCNQGICRRCALRVNGSVRLACTHRVWDENLCIEPRNKKYVKDLVVQ